MLSGHMHKNTVNNCLNFKCEGVNTHLWIHLYTWNEFCTLVDRFLWVCGPRNICDFADFCRILSKKSVDKQEMRLLATPAGSDIPLHELTTLPSIRIRTTGDNKEKDSNLALPSR